MANILQFLKEKVFGKTKTQKTLAREELEKKAVQGAEKAAREHRRVFERLAEYDRTR